jgi:hypothetical protein
MALLSSSGNKSTEKAMMRAKEDFFLGNERAIQPVLPALIP